jgi:hypothetical protein
MPVRINCPSCQASLSMPESMYGKAVRCPKCQSPFQCPSGPAEPAPEPRRRVSASAPAASGGNPFAFEEGAAAPALGGADDYQDERPSRRSSSRRLGGWDRVQSGFLFLYISAGCFVAWFLVMKFLLLKPGTFKDPTAAKIVGILTCLLFVGGTVLGVLGQLRCSAIPATSGAKGAATSALIFMVLAAIASTITTVLILAMMFSSDPVSLLKLLPFFLLTSFGALAGSFILYIFFLTITAIFLKQKGLLSSIMAYVVFLAVSPFAYQAFGMTATLLGGPSMGGGPGPRGRGPGGASEGDDIWSYLPLLYMAVAALWFVFLLVPLSSSISRARRRGNS